MKQYSKKLSKRSIKISAIDFTIKIQHNIYYIFKLFDKSTKKKEQWMIFLKSMVKKFLCNSNISMCLFICITSLILAVLSGIVDGFSEYKEWNWIPFWIFSVSITTAIIFAAPPFYSILKQIE